AEAAAEKMGLYRRDPGGWRGCRRTVSGRGEAEEGLRGWPGEAAERFPSPQNEVSVSCRPSAEFAGNVYRGEGIVPASPRDVWECIKPVAGGLRTKWDQNVKDFEVVEVVSDVSSL
ncbi:STAR5 protein, partial [Podargus strigoides]|nr:STAR5 protein [Podargus strigoides]